MGRTLYIDPWAGASGDMFLAALVDTGIHARTSTDGALCELDPEAVLEEAVACLGLEGVWVEVSAGREGGFACRRVEVHDGGATVPRTLADLEDILSAARLSAGVVARSRRALRRLASVEAGLHGVGVDEVHLHELGAADTLVDVVGTMALVEALGVEAAVHGPVPVGGGRVTAAHGVLSVPAPATLALLQDRPVFGGAEDCEVTTPTGALLVTELAGSWGRLPSMVVEGVGFGAGRRTLGNGPNLLRLVVGRAARTSAGAACGAGVSHEEAGAAWREEAGAAGPPGPDRVVELRTTIDDLSGEVLGHLHGLLLEGGALEAWFTPVYMKKARPAVELAVICASDDEERVVELMMRESTSFGVRRTLVGRHRLERSWVDVDVDGVAVAVKVGGVRGRVMSLSPEYESAAAAAAVLGRPLKDVMRDAAAAAARSVGPPGP